MSDVQNYTYCDDNEAKYVGLFGAHSLLQSILSNATSTNTSVCP